MPKTDIFLIKDLSRLSGLSIFTIKYYLNLGLIKEVGRSPETSFRYFDNSTLTDLKKIIEYKRQNISLSKIADLMKDKAAL